ncbi:MAG: hypothetical protein RBG13Loki_3894 [Promethearchaeota archaeon CR_4]|nr:MAG: hypothetical protein RBG13Loki_3894 [Candidatus Lokiarchaeota archaeon CR_4]
MGGIIIAFIGLVFIIDSHSRVGIGSYIMDIGMVMAAASARMNFLIGVLFEQKTKKLSE